MTPSMRSVILRYRKGIVDFSQTSRASAILSEPRLVTSDSLSVLLLVAEHDFLLPVCDPTQQS